VGRTLPEQLPIDKSVGETNIILDKDGQEVCDIGWASWRERTLYFIEEEGIRAHIFRRQGIKKENPVRFDNFPKVVKSVF
jgi:hypothetical protein